MYYNSSLGNTDRYFRVLACNDSMNTRSNSSDPVGYIKRTINSGAWDTISYPFFSLDMQPGAILEGQFGQDDVIQDLYSGNSTTYFDNYGWFSSGLNSLRIGDGYCVYRDSSNTALDYYIVGKVDPQPVTIHIYPSGWSVFSLNDYRSIPISELQITGASPDDVIQDIQTGSLTTYYDGYGWFSSSLEYIEPGHAYWYFTESTTGFDWSYNPNTSRSSSVTNKERRVRPSIKILRH